jgi:integrase
VASITRETNGRRLIQFLAGDGKRKSIRLGKVTQRIADEIKVKVEYLLAATTSGYAIDGETSQWLAKIGNDLADKLAAVDLIPRRASAQLKPFLDALIAQRTDVKPNTRRNLEVTKDRLVEFFGPGKNLRDINPGDADAWLLWMREKYAKGTAGRTVRRAKQLFRSAVRKKLIVENPFIDLKAPSEANEARKFFVPKADTQKVLDSCPNLEWQLLFALSRFGGLRCPSEHVELKWVDVDWARNRFWVSSPKTEHHEGHEGRWVPIFPELRPYLEQAFELAEPGTAYVINRYRDASVNLRTQLLRIIKRAGVEPWPKLFQNLRASRETELAEQYPIHVVCKWIGHAAKIAEKHYLQVRDEYFDLAAGGAADSDAEAVQNPVQHAAAASRTDLQELAEAQKGCGVALVGAGKRGTLQNEGMPLVGLEPFKAGLLRCLVGTPRAAGQKILNLARHSTGNRVSGLAAGRPRRRHANTDLRPSQVFGAAPTCRHPSHVHYLVSLALRVNLSSAIAKTREDPVLNPNPASLVRRASGKRRNALSALFKMPSMILSVRAPGITRSFFQPARLPPLSRSILRRPLLARFLANLTMHGVIVP